MTDNEKPLIQKVEVKLMDSDKNLMYAIITDSDGNSWDSFRPIQKDRVLSTTSDKKTKEGKPYSFELIASSYGWTKSNGEAVTYAKGRTVF